MLSKSSFLITLRDTCVIMSSKHYKSTLEKITFFPYFLNLIVFFISFFFLCIFYILFLYFFPTHLLTSYPGLCLTFSLTSVTNYYLRSNLRPLFVKPLKQRQCAHVLFLKAALEHVLKGRISFHQKFLEYSQVHHTLIHG